MATIKLHIDSFAYSEKPEEFGTIKPRLQNEKTIRELNVENLMDLIVRGHTISPAILINGCSAKNWLEQQLFMVDIDNKNKGNILSVDKAIEICEKNNILPAFYYYTFNHNENIPKYRLCFITKNIITDISERDIITNILYSLFSQSDKSGTNADRIFLGTNKTGSILNIDNRITLDDLIKISIPQKKKIIKSEDNELETLKNNFDFLEFLKKSNGNVKNSNENYYMFHNCEICNHKNNLVYWKDSKNFKCFSCDISGSIIDYLMATKNFDLKEAIEYFKYNLMGINRIVSSENNELINKFKELDIKNNYDINDIGISKLFSDINKNKCRFNITSNKWLYYNGKIWVENEIEIQNLAEEFANNLLIYSITYKNNELRRYADKLIQYKNRENLIKDSKNIHYVTINDLDKSENLFNCLNGTFDLNTYELREHDSDDLLTKISNVKYDKTAKSDLFINFINTIMEFDFTLIDFLQTILGYSLTADTMLECMFIFYGNTARNGKSTLISAYSNMLGNDKGYAVNANAESFAKNLRKDSRGPSDDIARLSKARFVSVSEAPKDMLLDNSFIKNVTGGDMSTARHLNQASFEYKPKYKLFFNTNHLPSISDDTIFSSNRIIVIPFKKHFTPEEQDILLKDKLKEEKEISGIFNWCIEGLKKIKDNKFKIVLPITVIEAINEYREESDIIEQFIKYALKENKNSVIKLRDCYTSYINYCKNNNCGYETFQSFKNAMIIKNLYVKSGTINKMTFKNVIKGYCLKQLGGIADNE